jgi:hypothetical protein
MNYVKNLLNFQPNHSTLSFLKDRVVHISFIMMDYTEKFWTINSGKRISLFFEISS